MNDEKQKIINYAHEKFFNVGFYKVTMYEIASELKMSKKTIYKHFKSKDELVEGVFWDFSKTISAEIERIVESDNNAIIKITMLLETISKVMMKLNQKIIFDIQNYMPSFWQKIDSFRTQMIQKNFTKLINQGKSENLIIDKPTNILIAIYISAIREVINPKFIMENNYSLNNALNYTFDILLNGISTTKGKNIFNKIIHGKNNANK